jgi:hypothetical protein
LWWAATGIGIACLAVFFIAVIGIVMVLPNKWIKV